jgi:hypothetical protein
MHPKLELWKQNRNRADDTICTKLGIGIPKSNTSSSYDFPNKIN